MYRTSARALFAGFALAVCLGPVAASAQAAQPMTVEQVRASFVGAGFQVDQARSWSWTAPPVTTLQIFDRASGRVLMALVYPDATAAQTERLQAQAREPAPPSPAPDGYGPHLVPGYGQSLWRANVAVVETTQSELDRVFRWQTDGDNSMFVDTLTARDPGPPTYAVDLDFRQALESSVISL